MIIGITGTNGAGKGTVVDYLVKHKGFKHYSVREFLYEEIDRRGLPRDRNSTNLVGNDLRKRHGPGYIAEQLLRRVRSDAVPQAVIESIRSVGEAEYLVAHGAILWGVDADRRTRYERAVLRGSGTDRISFEEFIAQEERELQQKEKFDMNIKGVMAMASVVLHNNGTREELYAQVEQALASAK